MSAPEQATGGRRRFRPSFWATVCTVVSLAILIGLGTWQVQRLFWKEGEIEKRQTRVSAPAVPLPESFPDPAQMEFTRVRLEGRFLHDQEFHLGARTDNGRVGYHIVTPFALTDGRVVLVDRGWVPENRRDPITRVEGQIEGPMTIEGLLRTGGWKGFDFARPPNKPEERFYFWLDLPVMAQTLVEAGVSEAPVITEVYVDAVASEVPGGLPVGGQTRVNLPNDHLEYAITWYAFAVILAVIWFLYSYQREDDGQP